MKGGASVMNPIVNLKRAAKAVKSVQRYNVSSYSHGPKSPLGTRARLLLIACLFVLTQVVVAQQAPASEGPPSEGASVSAAESQVDPKAARSVISKAIGVAKSALSRAGDRLKSIDIKLNLPVDLIQSESFRFGGKYTFESEPLYQGNIHLRADHWTFSAAIPVGDSVRVIDGNSMGGEVRKEARISFIRPFPERSYALNELYAYSPARMPWTADIALNRLEPGDVAVLTSQLSLLVSATAAPTIEESLQKMNKALPFVTTHYLLKGEFQIHVTRLEGSWVQLKVIPVFGDEAGIKVGIKPAERLEIFALNLINRRIERWSRIDQGVLFAEFVKRDGFLGLVNYKLNLDSQNTEIRTAYNNILKSALSLDWLDQLGIEPDDVGGFAGLFAATVSPAVFRLFNPLSNREEKLEGLIADASELETLLAKSLVLAPDRRAIDRDFFGRVEYDEPGSSRFGVNLLLWRASRSSEYKDLFIAAESSEGKGSEYFRVGIFDRITDSSLLFSLFKERAVSSAFAVFTSDARQQIGAMKDLVFEWEYRDKSLSKSEFQMVQESLKQSLPGPIFSSVDWAGFSSGRSFDDSELKLRLIFDPRALDLVSGLDYQMAHHWDRLSRFLLSIPAPTAQSAAFMKEGDSATQPAVGKSGRLESLDYYHYDIEVIATKLTAVFEGYQSTAGGLRTLTPNERFEAFADLRANPLFIEIGPGYLLSLLPEAELVQRVGFEFSMTASGVAPASLPARFGRPTQQFKNIATIRSVLKTGVGGGLADLYQDVATEITERRLQVLRSQ